MSEEMDRDLSQRIRGEYRSGPALDVGARDRLLARIRGAPRPARPRLGFRRPALRTLAMLAAAAALVVWLAAAMLPGLGPKPGVGVPSPPDAEMLRFEIAATGAERVVLVGDFNGWDPHAAPMQRAGATDTWAVTVAVPRGRHVYAFLVNGERWLADPQAPLAPEDGFGVRNSVLVVGGPSAS